MNNVTIMLMYNESTPPQDSFGKKQLKTAATTFTIASVATMTVTFWVNIGIVCLVLFFIVLGAIAASGSEGDENGRVYSTTYGSSDASAKILSIPVRGPIEGSAADSGYGGLFADPTTVYGYDLKQELIDAADSGEYDGVVLEINSPGGTIYGAKAITDGVKYFKQKTQRPVYASIQGMAASGGYWTAVSADKVYADTGTGAGSIGVIFGPFTYFDKLVGADGYVTENGIEESYLTAGEGKDAGNPFRKLTDKEKAVFQEAVDDNYEDFVSYVSERRHITKEDITGKIGAHYYGEKQAIERKLIDTVASPQEVYAALAKQAGVEGDYQIVSSHTDLGGIGSLLGIKLPWVAQKNSETTKRDYSKAQACSSSIAVPLVYYGNPAQACKSN